MGDHSGSSIHRDIASAYIAAAARIASWVVVSAVVFRVLGPAPFAMLALARATVGLLGYTSVGLAPAMIRLLAVAQSTKPLEALGFERVLRYAGPAAPTPLDVYASGMTLAMLFGFCGLLVGFFYGIFFDRIHVVPPAQWPEIGILVVVMSIGIVTRLVSDVPGAVLQTTGRISLDNLLIAAAEIAWAVSTALVVYRTQWLPNVGMTLLVVNFILLMTRGLLTHSVLGPVRFRDAKRGLMLPLLSFGMLVMFAQLADFLYAPTDYILINRLLDPLTVAAYVPAVQIDAALLVLVSGLAGVLLPKTALAHARGSIDTVRAYYVRGTLASIGLLTVAALSVFALSPIIFTLWLNDSMPATQAILPLVLIHTVIGGSSIVGRSILLGIGRVKPFTISVLIAGVTNVALSILFVAVFDMGLRGIIYGTIVAVTLRCAIWMPWYVMRTIRRGEAVVDPVVAPPPADLIA